MEWNDLQEVISLYSGHFSPLPVFTYLFFIWFFFLNFGFDDFILIMLDPL